MSYGPYDLRLTKALAGHRLASAERVRIGSTGRLSLPGTASPRRHGRARGGLPRPAHGAAGGS